MRLERFLTEITVTNNTAIAYCCINEIRARELNIHIRSTINDSEEYQLKSKK